jgi:uncharacterized caspase-like protein
MTDTPHPETRKIDDPAEDTTTSNRMPLITQQQAIVVGINTYQTGRLLTNAVHDATALATLLQQDYGFALLPAGEPLLDAAATRETFCMHVQASLAQADERTRWLCYFAGHGQIVNGQGYLLPVDAQVNMPDSLISIPWLVNQMLESACAEALLILDVCYGGQALVQMDDIIPSGAVRNRVRQVITSGNPDQEVLDGGGTGHSLFTQTLCNYSRGKVSQEIAF